MKTHELKIESAFFAEVEQGNKRFEIRLNDRDYQKGDRVTLREWGPLTYTGNELTFDITYVTSYRQVDGFVVFGIGELEDF